MGARMVSEKSSSTYGVATQSSEFKTNQALLVCSQAYWEAPKFFISGKVQDKRLNLSVETCQNLLSSIPDRVKAFSGQTVVTQCLCSQEKMP